MLSSLLQHGRRLAGGRRARIAAAFATTVVAATSLYVVIAQTAPPDLPPIALSDVPLMAAVQGDKPAMVLALSVEFPTVGAQYMAPDASPTPPIRPDRSYSNATEYIGYYDANSCYRYNDAPAETPPAGRTVQDMKRFDRIGPATDRMCADAFSGNFLNWASGSAVDIMRMALSGGDRYIDTPTLTTLQRAVLPDGTRPPVPCFFNSLNFPAKKLDRNGGGANNYFGAIPALMRARAGGQDVWVGNMLDQIYFAARTTDPPAQDCSVRTSYRLGAAIPPPPANGGGVGPVTVQPAGTTLPANATWHCADGTETCGVPWDATNQQVFRAWYGSGTNWSTALVRWGYPCRTDAFGDPGGTGTKACHLVPAGGVSAWTSEPGVPGLNTEGYFFARVKVCDANPDGTLADQRDYGLCARYPNGNYKPVGAIQKYADKVRLAVFGYLMDQTRPAVDSGSSFGGVLRAPMKYVGEKAYDEFGTELAGQNPAREWDLSTGVFLANPDAHAMGSSGVVNYLNKFGRTNAGAPGRYKIFDPVSELHYEAMRYLQGKQPSALAVGRLDADRIDGFPAYASWTDPYGGSRTTTADYSCLRSSVVVVGDINTNDPDNNRFNRTDVDGAPNGRDVPNVTAWNGWRGVALAFEALTAMPYTDGAGLPRSVNRTPTALNPQNTSAVYSPLIGTAYWARSHDIRPAGSTRPRPGLRVRSIFFDVNEWGQSGGTANASFRRSRNQFFTAAKYGGYDTDAATGNTWGNPFKREDGTDSEDVWQRRDQPGEARTYYLAEDARKVLSAFDDIFKTASTAARSIAGSAVSSGELTAAGSYAYQGAFNTEDWSGDVLAFRLTLDASGAPQIPTAPSWRAAARLGAMTDPAATRKIFTGPRAATPAARFTWDSIDQALKDELSRSSPLAAPDTLGPDRLAYLRGDRSREGSPFRRRASLMGDVVNSGVAFLGAPGRSLLGESGYADFHEDHADRTPAVFVGANDGMLHAFNGNTGDELFAYIPSWLGPKLSSLANPGYIKQAYVDATPVVGEARVGADWRSVLVSGSGGGGRGVFALDVTDAAGFAASDVMWEFTSADDPDLGFVLGKPAIVKLRTNSPSESTPVYQWFAMVASGINNYVPDASGANFSASGRPALFLLSLDKQPGDRWCAPTSGNCGNYNYYKLSFPFEGRVATGVINFRPIFGPDRQVTAVYAGDLQGNLWKLDFTRWGSSDWEFGRLSAFNAGSEAQPLPLFIARDAGGNRQPITMAPSVAAGPRLQGRQTAYVAFGTGRYMEVPDVANPAVQSFYVVFDPGTNQADSATPESAISGRGRLAQGTATASSVTIPAFRWGSPQQDADLLQRAGYFFDFPGTGERGISNAAIVGNSLVFGSLHPQAGSNQPCGPRRGGNQYTLNLDSGNGTVRQSDVGLMGEPLAINIPGRTSYQRSDTTGRRLRTTVTEVLQQGSAGIGSGGSVTTTVIAGRLNWRQVHNYDEARSNP